VLRCRHVLAGRNDVAVVGSGPGGGHRLRILGGLIAGALACSLVRLWHRVRVLDSEPHAPRHQANPTSACASNFSWTQLTKTVVQLRPTKAVPRHCGDSTGSWPADFGKRKPRWSGQSKTRLGKGVSDFLNRSSREQAQTFNFDSRPSRSRSRIIFSPIPAIRRVH
jgi:hypothetical protein